METEYAPARQIGRISDDEWEELKTHVAEHHGDRQFTQWALRTLQEQMRLERKLYKRNKEVSRKKT